MATLHCKGWLTRLNLNLLCRALCCAHDTIKNKIFTSDQDHIGVVLFGCRPLATPHSDFKTVR